MDLKSPRFTIAGHFAIYLWLLYMYYNWWGGGGYRDSLLELAIFIYPPYAVISTYFYYKRR